MNRTNQHLGVVLIATFVILIIIAVALTSLSRMTSSVSAVAPPTPVPPFDGEAFTAVIDSSLLNQTPVNIALANADWTEVLSETFESALGIGWTSVDVSTTDSGEYKWEREDFTPSPTMGDTTSAWAVGGGLEGSGLTVNVDGYPNNVDSWLIYGPIDMSGVISASLTFDYWLEVDGGDGFAVAVSTSGSDTATFTGSQTFNTTPPNTWSSSSYDLSSVFGESTVYIGFNFTSDASGNAGNLPGALLDNIRLLVQSAGNVYLPVIRKDPTPTPSPTPTGGTDYRDDFTNDIAGWELRRADTQDKYDIYHGDSGVLNVFVEDPDDYIIVSPLVAAPSLPYSLEMSAQHKDPEEKDLYGLVFGGDWDGTTCPNSNFSSCFETYYVLKVEYRTNDGTYLRFKLQRVNSHTDNHPIDVDNLIDWTKVSTDENDYNKWRVEIEADNDIKIYLNNVRVGSVRDNDLSGFINPYFGVLVQTKEVHGNFRAKFDYFDVSAQ